MKLSVKSKKLVIVSTSAIIIIAVIITAIVSVWASRPVVDYNLTGYAYTVGQFDFNPYGPVFTSEMPDTYTFVNSNTPLIVALHWENKGNVDASLQLTLTTKNANITWFSSFGSDNMTAPFWATESDGQPYNGTIATFLSETKGHSTMQYKYVDIIPIGNPQNFTITFSVKDASNGFSSLFPSGKTIATYELTNANVYQLVN
jgi:hypothetical protein